MTAPLAAPMTAPKAVPLSAVEFRTLTGLARRAMWAPETRAALQAERINISPANFYAPIPALADLDRAFEYRDPDAAPFNGGLFDPDRMAAEIAAMVPFAADFDPPADGDTERPEGFFWRNPAFSWADAMAYYAMIRRHRPAEVIEIGSGFSTLVADRALRDNGQGRLTLIEPYPKPFLRTLPTVDRIIETPVQDIPAADLAAMVDRAGFWFIDSTHTVKAGSDCLWIYLKVMPALAKAVIVHSHDIWLPYAMPVSLIRDRQIYWTEQHLLYAFMLGNPRVEVLFGSAFADRVLPEATAQLMQGRWRGGGGSLWYRIAPR
jgi:hypothetical protein